MNDVMKARYVAWELAVLQGEKNTMFAPFLYFNRNAYKVEIELLL